MLQLDGRRRAHLLATDLAFLGWSDREVDALPLCVIPRPLDTSGRIAGSLYVKEGALLGGRVLARKLDILLEPGLNGRRFFAGSEHDSELWRNFCSAIEAPVFADHIGDMVTAACETFELFEQWISGQM